MPKTLDLSLPPPSCKAVIRALEERGVEKGWKLYRGEGYLYFMAPDDHPLLKETGVYVPRLSDLTLKQWIEEFQRITGRGDDLKRPPAEPARDTVTITHHGGKTVIKLHRD